MWARCVGAVSGIVVLIAVGIDTRAGRSPWPWILWVLLAALYGSMTFNKLTNAAPVGTSWDSHIRFSLAGTMLALFGLHALALPDRSAAGGRLMGLLGVIGGIMMLVAEERDYQRWRAAVAQEREAADEEASAQIQYPRPRSW